MKIMVTIARILLGIIFLVFGLNGFLQFLPSPPLTGFVKDFIGAMFSAHYHYGVFAVQLVGGILLLAGQYVPLALTLLGPVIFNILLFHFTMDPGGLPLALFTTLLWVIVFWWHRAAFAPLFVRSS
jgi:putative oxidoreductase